METASQPAKASDPTARAMLARGVALQLDGDLEGACREYEAALAAEPQSAVAWNNLGFARTQQGRLDEAVDCYERALQIDPSRSMAHANLALVLHARRRPRGSGAAATRRGTGSSQYARGREPR